MKNYAKAVFVGFFVCWIGNAQVGIGNTSPKATLDIEASNNATPANTDGILIPRINAFPTTSPTAAQNGMLVFLTTDTTFYYWKNSTTSWVAITGTGAEKINDLSDGKSDNDGTEDGSSVFLGISAGLVDDSSDNKNVGVGYHSMLNNTSGYWNTSIGANSLSLNSTGFSNVALGYESLKKNTTGFYNVSLGTLALAANTSGTNNIAIGGETLTNNTVGDSNVSVGSSGMYKNTSGGENSTLGINTLYSNTTGSRNIAIGSSSMYKNDIGLDNSALGSKTLYSNTSGNNNTAIGNYTAYSNTTASFNTAVGNSALYQNTTGGNNTALGTNSLYTNTTGENNVAVGFDSLLYSTTSSGNTAMGVRSLYRNTSGFENLALGYESLSFNTQGRHNVALGIHSLWANLIGSFNVSIGGRALQASNSSYNVGIGYNSGNNLTSGSYNVIIGCNSLEFPNPTSWYQLNIGNIIYGNNIDGTSNTISSGNIGIGIKNPSERLDIEGNLTIRKTTENSAILLQSDDIFVHLLDNVSLGDGVDAWMLSTKEGTNETSGIYGGRDFVTVWAPADSNRMIRFLDEDQWADNDGSPYNNSAELAYVDASGQFVQASDKNRKQNFKNITNAIQKINQINGYTYEYKLNATEKQKGNQPIKTSGVIAQELYKVLPEAVQINEYGEYFVHYAGIIPLLIEALKEQQKEIEVLKERVSELGKLEDRILALERKNN